MKQKLGILALSLLVLTSCETLTAIMNQVAAEEKSIRKNPEARINALLKQVFGQLDAQ